MPTFPIFSFGLSDTAGRPTNEDAISLSDHPEPAKLASHGRLYVVADGTGGQEGGGTASAVAAKAVAENYYDNASEDPGESLRTAIQSAHQVLFHMAEGVASWRSMSTTMVAAAIKDNGLWVAYVGDSRLYLIRGGKIRQITRDHVWEQDDDNLGSLTRWLGGGDQPTVEVDIAHETLQDGDVIILCSDGLYNFVSKEDMIDLARRAGVKSVVQQMIAIAKARDTKDNASAIAVRFGGAVVEGAQKRQQMTLLGIGAAVAFVLIVAVIAIGSGNRSNGSVGTVGTPGSAQPTSVGPGKLIITGDDVTTAASDTTSGTATATPEIGPTSTRKPTSTATATAVARPTTSNPPVGNQATAIPGGNPTAGSTPVPSCPSGQFWDPVMNRCKGSGGGGGDATPDH